MNSHTKAPRHYEIDLGSLAFQFKQNQVTNAAESYAVFSSVDGFTVGDEIVATRVTTNSTWLLQTVPLGSFTDITAATEFRIYMYGASGANSGFTGFDEITLTGNVVLVPEPSPLRYSASDLPAC